MINTMRDPSSRVRFKVYRQYLLGKEVCNPDRPLSTSVTEKETGTYRSASPLAGLYRAN